MPKPLSMDTSTYAEVYFDIKCLGLTANQDAGALVKNNAFKDCEVQYLTQTGVGVRLNVNDITTYGGGAFKTGLCTGYLILRNFVNSSFQDPLYLSPTSFDEVKTGGNAFFRFNFLQQQNVTGFVVVPLSI